MGFAIRLASDKLFQLDRPAVMGVINVSSNSFYNAHQNFSSALDTAVKLVAEGVDIIDVGGEATSPHVNIAASKPDMQAELDLVVPVVKAIRERFDTLISVDTSTPQVMHAAVDAGAHMVNDQRALQVEDALQVVSELKVPVCLMHSFPAERKPGECSLETLMRTVISDLLARADLALAAGIAADRIILDPGFGQGNYAKNYQENFYLLANLKKIVNLGYPVLSGWSRKSMIGDALGGVPPEQRLSGTIAADTLAAFMGAQILRGHDVQATKDAIIIAQQVAVNQGDQHLQGALP